MKNATHAIAVFGRRASVVALSALMVLSGVPTAALAEVQEEVEAYVEETAPATEETAADQNATEETAAENTSEQSSGEQQSEQAAVQETSTEAATPAAPTEADVALSGLEHASVKKLDGQQVNAPATKVTVSNSEDFKFTVEPSNGYSLKAVKLTVSGVERELTADSDNVYTVSAADVTSGASLKLETEETPLDGTSTNSTDATSIDDATTDNSQAEDEGSDSSDSADASESESGSESATTDEAATDDSLVNDIAKEDEAEKSESTETETDSKSNSGSIFDWFNNLINGNPTTTAETAASDKGTDTDTEKWIYVGETATFDGTSGYNVQSHSWSTSDSKVATVSGSSSTGTVTGVAAGDATITHTYKTRGGFWGGSSSTKTETFTIHVVEESTDPVTSATISGADTVEAFSSTQLSLETEPEGAKAKSTTWTSSNEEILTVDSDGKVTGARQGTATVTATITNSDGTTVTAEKSIEVTATTTGSTEAEVYYLLDPTKDANSNDTGNWGPAYGVATVNTENATWTNNKNCFDNVDQRVVSWPNDSNVIDKNSSAWQTIFDNYKANIKAQLGVDISEDDVEEISLVPAKISKNNGGTYPTHLDCNVNIKMKGLSLVKYYLRDAGSAQWDLKGSKSYFDGNTTQPSDVTSESFPETKTKNGVTYTFSGWYLDQNLTQPVTFPYTVTTEQTFYAKYVGGFQVKYDLAGGTWNNSDSLMYTVEEGKTVTVKKEPTREGYKFTGWTVTGLDGTTTVTSGDTFTMPSGNVTITANWEELTAYQVQYWEQGTSNQIADAVTRYGEMGSDVSADAIVVEGYHLASNCPATITKTLGEGDNTIIFWYVKDDASYTVNYYVNGTETKVADSETKSAAWGTTVKASDLTKDISGYTVVPDQTASIELSRTEANTINVYYYINTTLTANSDTVEYNGEEQSVAGYTSNADGVTFEGVELEGGKGTDVGSYAYTFKKDTVGKLDTTNKYIVSEATDGSLTISPNTTAVTIKVSGNKDSVKYDGKSHEVSGYTVDESTLPAGVSKDEISLSGTAKVAETDAGTYAMGLDAKNFGLTTNKYSNVTFEVVEDGSLTIEKRNIKLTSGSAEQYYTGTALTNSTVTEDEDSDGFADGEGATYDTTGSQTLPGSSDNAFGVTLNSNTKASNYNITKTEGTLTVKDRTDKNKKSVTVTGNSESATYDGAEHKAEGITDASKTFTWSGVTFYVEAETSDPSSTDAFDGVKTNKVSNVKIYDAPSTATTRNDVTKQFKVNIANGTLSVAKRSVTLTSGSAEKTYDGEALTKDEVTVTSGSFVNGEGYTATVTGSQTAPGSSENKFSYELSDNTKASNYDITTVNGTLNVKNRDAKYEITVEGNSTTAEYDGTEKSATGLKTTTFTLENGKTYTVEGLSTSDPKSTDATDGIENTISGTAVVKDSDGNDVTSEFSVSLKSGKLVVNKRAVELTSASDKKSYDGNALTNSKVTVTSGSFVEGEEPTYSFTGTQTNVGKSENKFTANGVNENNYALTYKYGTLEVTQSNAKVVVTITGNTENVTYDGNGHEAKGYTVSSDNALYTEDCFSFSGNASVSGTNAGSYAMGLSKDQFSNTSKNFKSENVTFVVNDGALNIAKRAVTLTSGSASKTYDGVELTNSEVTVTSGSFVGNEGFTATTSGSILDAGSVENKFEYTLNDGTNKSNYDIATVYGTLTVKQVEDAVTVTIKGSTSTVTYDGNEHKVEDYDVTVTGSDLYSPEYVAFGGTKVVSGTDAGAYTMGLSASQFSNTSKNFKNVTIKVVNDGQLVINKRNVTLTSGTSSKTYDGTALTNGNVAVSGDGFAEGEGADYSVTGSQTVVGNSANSFSYTLYDGKAEGKKETKASNYNVTTAAGTLTVTSRDAKYEITVEANSATVTYDGKEHTASGLVATEFEVDGQKYTVSGLSTEDPAKTNAGTYTNNINGTAVVKDANGNDVSSEFKVNTKNGQLVINKRNVTLTSASDSKTYDGTALTNSEVAVEGDGFVKGEEPSYNVTGSITDAGEVENAYTYTAPASVAKTENGDYANYVITKNTGMLTVSPVKETVKVTITGHKAEYTYDNQAHKAEGYDFKSSNKLFTENLVNFKGSASVEQTNVGTYAMGLDKSQFSTSTLNFESVEFEVTDGELKISGAEIDNDGVKWAGKQDVSKYYDGTPIAAHEASATDKYGNALTVEYSADGKTWTTNPAEVNLTHAGEVTVQLRAANSNYAEGSYATGTEKITVNKRSVILTSATDAKTYDGAALTNGAVTATDYDKTDAADGGHGFVSGEGYAVDVTGTITDAGSTPNSFTYTLNEGTSADDYVVTTSEGTLTVSQRNVTLTSATDSKAYDGKALTNDEVTVSGEGFVDGQGASYDVTGTQTAPGTSQNGFTYSLNEGTKAGNYNITANYGTLTVTSRDAKVELTVEGNSGTYTYDGQEHSATGIKDEKTDADGNKYVEFAVDGETYKVYGLTASGATATDVAVNSDGTVGSYSNTVTGTPVVKDANGNDVTSEFKVTPVSGSLTINKRDVTIVSDSATRTYNGSELTKHTWSYAEGSQKLVAGDELIVSYSGAITNVGSVANTFSVDGFKTGKATNYSLHTQEGTLAVTANEAKVVVTISGKTDSETYDGKQHSVSGYDVKSITLGGKETTLYGSSDFSLNGGASAAGTDAGTYAMGLTSESFTNNNANFTNVEFVVTDGGITVTKRNVTLTSGDYTGIYDGQAHTNNNVTVGNQGFVSGEGATYTFPESSSITNAGIVANEFSYELNEGTSTSNYNITTSYGRLVVGQVETQVTVTITGNTSTVYYDGAEHAVTGYEFSSDNKLYTNDKMSGPASDEVSVSGTNVTYKEGAVTSYAMGLAESQFSNADTTNFKNVKFVVTDGSLTINPRKVVMSSADGSKEYDGLALTKNDPESDLTISEYSEEEGTGFVDGEGVTYTITGSQTTVGSSKNAFSYVTNEGTNLSNYSVSKTEGTLTVTSRGAKYAITVTGKSDEVTYDKTEHSVDGLTQTTYKMDNGATYTVSATTGVKGTNAGTYENAPTNVRVFDSKGNDVTDQFAVTPVAGTLTIKQREITITSASAEKTYDGTPLTKNVVAEDIKVEGNGFVEGDEPSYTFASSSTITNAGSVTNAFSYTLPAGVTEGEGGNYKIAKVEGTLKVNKVTDNVVVTVRENSQQVSYTGSEQGISGYAIESVMAGDTDYSSICKEDVDFAWAGEDSHKTAKGTNVGFYPMTIDSSDFENISQNFENITFVIEDGGLTVAGGDILPEWSATWNKQDVSKTYDGTALSAYAATATDNFGNVLSIEYSTDGENWSSELPSRTDAGTTTVQIRATCSNYGETQYYYSTEDITVNKRAVTLVSAGNTWTYDGKEHKEETAGVKVDETHLDFVEGQGVKSYSFSKSVTDVTSGVDNEFTYELADGTDANNYEISKEYGKLVVTEAGAVVVKIKGNSDTVKYDGTEHSVSGYTVESITIDGQATDLYTADDFSFSGDATVSATDVKVGSTGAVEAYAYALTSDMFENTNSNFSNVTFVIDENEPAVSLTITKRKVTLTSDSGDKKYDGKTITRRGVTVAGEDGFVDGENVSQNYGWYDDNNILPGEYTNRFDYALKSGTKAQNYDITTIYGTLRVDNREDADKYEVAVTGNSTSVFYDGQEHKAEGITDASKSFSWNGLTYYVEATTSNPASTNATTSDLENVVSGVVVKDANGNDVTAQFKVTTKNGTLTVAKRNVTLTSESKTGDNAFAYDGAAHTAKTVTATAKDGKGNGFIDGEGFEADVTGNITNVGEATNTFTYSMKSGTSEGNYNITKVEGTLEVKGISASENLTVTPADTSKTYDGSALSAGEAKVAGKYGENAEDLKGLKVEYSLDNATWTEDFTSLTRTDAGATKVYVRVSADNYTGYATATETISVSKREITVTSGSASKVYDGTALEEHTASVTSETGLVGSESLAYTYTGSQTEAGSSKNAFAVDWSNSTAKSGNYKVSFVTGDLTVTAQSINPKKDDGEPNPDYSGATVNEPSDVTYDGQEHKWVPEVKNAKGETLTEGNDYDVTYTDKDGNEVTDFTNVTGEITVTITGKGNYSGTVTRTYQITAREVKLVSADGTWTYDGKEHTKSEQSDVTVAEGSFVEGEGFTYTFDESAKVKDVTTASVENKFTYEANEGTSASNYSISTIFGSLSVTKDATGIVVNIHGYEGAYDGQEHKATLSATGTLPEGYRYVATSDASITNAGETEAKIDGFVIYDESGNDVTSNFDVNTSATATLKVTKRAVTVKSADATKVYDGSELTKHEASVTSATGVVEGEAFTYSYTGAQTEVGGSDNTFAVDWSAEGTTAAEDNYDVTYVNGTLTVTQQSIDPGTDENPNPAYKGATVNSPNDVTYDAEDHKWTPTVKDGETTLEAGKDYTIAYKRGDSETTDFTNAGTITVVITGTGNYSGTVTKTYKIDPVAVTLTSNSHEYTFTGSAQSDAQVNVSGAGADLFKAQTSDLKANGSVTNAGDTATNVITYGWKSGYSESNYSVTNKPGTLTVVAKSIDTGAGMNVTTLTNEVYDGQSHQKAPVVTDGDKTLQEGVDYELTYKRGDSETTDFKNVGGITVVVTGKGNYTGSVERTYSVTKRLVTITSGTEVFTYDGAAHQNTTATVSTGEGQGFVAGEGVETYEFYNSVTSAGEERANSFKAASFKQGTDENNYAITYVAGKISVVQNASTIKVTLKNGTWTYDGTEHAGECEVTGVPEGFTYKVSLVGGTITNVGTSYARVGSFKIYDASGKDVTDQFSNIDKISTAQLRVNKATLTITTGSGNKTYDGTALTNGEITVDGLKGTDAVSAKATGSQTDAGSSKNTYSMSFTNGSIDNYAVTEVLGTLTVGKAPADNTSDPSKGLTIKGNDQSATYDGQAHQAGAATVTGVNGEAPKGLKVEYSLDGETWYENLSDVTVTDAGTYTVYVRASADNYDGYKTGTETIVVNKAKYSVTTASDSKVYDGTELTKADGATITGLVNGETAAVEGAGSITEVGSADNTYAITWAAEDNEYTAKESNYELDKATLGTLKVTGQSIDPTPGPDGNPDPSYSGVTTDDPENVTYDGDAHKWVPTVNDKDGNPLEEGKDYTVTYKDKDGNVIDPTDGNFTDAGTITVVIEGKGNYTGTITKKYTIDPRALTITSANGSWVYDGKAHKQESASVTEGEFVEGQGVEAYTFSNSVTAAGESKSNEFAYTLKSNTKASNYTITREYGTIAVTKSEAAVVVNVAGGSWTYDGQEHKATASVSNLPEGFTYEVVLKNDSITNAGEATAEVESFKIFNGELDVTQNFDVVTTATAKLTVNQKTLQVTTGSASKVFDGTELTAAGNVTGLVNEADATFAVTGTQTTAGTSENTYELTFASDEMAKNYNVIKSVGTLTVYKQSINPDAGPVDPTDPDSPNQYGGVTTDEPSDATYDGTDHKWTPTVTDKDGNPLDPEKDYEVKYYDQDGNEIDDFTNAKGEITVVITGKGEYTGEKSYTFEVKPATLTVNSESASKTYDGNALTAPGTLAGLVGDETATLTMGNSQTEVGSVSNDAYSIEWGTALASNYTVVDGTFGTLTVTAAPAAAPTATPTTPATPLDTVANVLEAAAAVVTGGTVAEETEQVFDAENPLGTTDTAKCWVHVYMVLGMIVTAIYGIGVTIRRKRFAKKLEEEMDDVLSGNKEGSEE